jgi:EAL domain-containing protein (putative c-di-GMP-specific phosphodiesterase class I)
MNMFCLMAIIVIFISFLNPDLFLSERGYVYNLPAFQALLAECHRRRRPCRVLGFTIQNYNEHREIFGGKQMDAALIGINRYLNETFPQMSSFYLRSGCYAVVGQNKPDLSALQQEISARFAQPWSTGAGELQLSVSFVEADTELMDCPSDRLVNTLMISLDELTRVSEPDTHRNLTDSIEEINQKLDIRKCLEKALENDELEVFLQPLVDCLTGRRVAAEALVRLRDDRGRLIRPDLFITMAEQEGYIVRLGEQVLSKVCRFIRDNDMEAIGIRWINVNLSPVQFMSRDIPARFAAILEEYGVKQEMIHLEITEQSMIDFSLLREQIIGLHENGFEFSLDDYGSGYSNLTRVRQYPFTNIKIDMEVVHNYCQDRDPLLPALVQGFKEMNLSITAEGIETREMAEILKGIGCDYLQGYYFSRPVPMSEFLVMDI